MLGAKRNYERRLLDCRWNSASNKFRDTPGRGSAAWVVYLFVVRRDPAYLAHTLASSSCSFYTVLFSIEAAEGWRPWWVCNLPTYGCLPSPARAPPRPASPVLPVTHLSIPRCYASLPPGLPSPLRSRCGGVSFCCPPARSHHHRNTCWPLPPTTQPCTPAPFTLTMAWGLISSHSDDPRRSVGAETHTCHVKCNTPLCVGILRSCQSGVKASKVTRVTYITNFFLKTDILIS